MYSFINHILSDSDRRVAQQTFWTGGITTVQILGGLAQVALTARILGPEGYGNLTVIIASTSIIYGFLAMPGGDAVLTFVTRSVSKSMSEEASSVLRFALVASIGLSLIAYILIIVLAFVAADLLKIDSSNLTAIVLYGVVGVLMATQAETLAVLRLADRISWGLAVTIVAKFTQVAVLVAAWLTDAGLITVIFALVIGAGVNGVGMLLAAAASAKKAGIPDFLSSFSVKVPPDV